MAKRYPHDFVNDTHLSTMQMMQPFRRSASLLWEIVNVNAKRSVALLVMQLAEDKRSILKVREGKTNLLR